MGRPRLEILDATLRDGVQAEGVSLSPADKVRLARALDDLGVDYIEGGWVGVNPKDDAFFELMRNARLRRARLAAFGLTRRAGMAAEKDPRMAALAGCGVDTVSLVGKASEFHVRRALRVGRAENLALIFDSIAFLKNHGKRVFFDAEHFFDGLAEDPEYALAAAAAARDAGADLVVLCDTNGGRLPEEIAFGVERARARLGDFPVGFHGHNDAGLALANTLAAAAAGAVHLQATLNGFGERCGMTDLCALLPALELKLGRRVVGARRLARLASVSRLAYELANRPPRPEQPYVGRSAFAHKGGLHVSAVRRDATTYEHVVPDAVGNGRRVLASELSGKASMAALLPEIAGRPELTQRLLDRVQKLEAEGSSFEDADGSFGLLLARMSPDYAKPFTLQSFRVITDRAIEDPIPDIPGAAAILPLDALTASAPRRALSEASARVRIGPAELHTVAEGEHGPVSALDAALRKALAHGFPLVEGIRLVDYRVHIVNAEAGVAARVRVVISWRAGRQAFGTMGVSEDVLAASCRALCDAYEWLILDRGAKAVHRRRPHRL